MPNSSSRVASYLGMHAQGRDSRSRSDCIPRAGLPSHVLVGSHAWARQFGTAFCVTPSLTSPGLGQSCLPALGHTCVMYVTLLTRTCDHSLLLAACA